MTGFDVSRYSPVDTAYLWWLGDPQQPALIGTITTARETKGVALRYAATWLQSGCALSEDLPLLDKVFIPAEKETAPGAVDDARPDRWGERVIRFVDKPPRLSLMEFLLFAGDERFGALGVSISADVYAPRLQGPLPKLDDVAAIERLVTKVLNGETIPPAERRLITPGATLGGARPKALLQMDNHQWVIKFAEPGDSVDMPLVEHACMTLAAKANIRVAQTRVIPLPKGHAVAVKRFDREGPKRRHAVSANVALKAAGETLGYPELAQILRRRGVAIAQSYRAQMHELFRRMVFNILIDNTDDHEKNHALLMTDAGALELAPAFDVLPSGQSLGYQQMRVGAQMTDSTIANALSESVLFGLKPDEALAEVRAVAAVVARWKKHFKAAGVSARDIDTLAPHIDRSALREQRSA